MKLPKLKLGRALKAVVRVAAPLILAGIAAKAQGKVEDLVKRVGK